jgi:radical SAM protein with 4Fe4S-binding SPASM domain
MSSGCLGEIAYSELAWRLVGGDAGARIPLSGIWDATERCNLACAHCYINQPAGDSQREARELRTAQICSILDEAAAEGCLWLALTGGEPFLRPDMLDVYRHAKRRGMLVTIFTNGTLLTPAIVDELAEWRPYKIEISLYGATAETYERVSGLKGSFARCVRGIDLVLERGLPLALKTMVLRVNRHELAGMMALARERGVEFRWDAELTPRLDGGTQNQAVALPAEESAQIDVGYPERAAEWRALLEKERAWRKRLERGEVSHTRVDSVYRCGAGLRSFHIDAYGRLSLCAIARRPAYDLTKGSFREGWGEFLAEARQARRRQRTACMDCDIAVLCSQCAGWSQLAHGDDETPEDGVCEVAHLRASALGVC